MARRTTPPSRAPKAVVAPARRQVDVRDWLGGIRLSGFMVIMLGLVVLAAFVLVPTLGTYLDQRQRIAALAEAVEANREEVAALEAESDRWRDPAYITTQARERLYYVKPGEVVYLVDNDLDAALLPQEQAPVSEEVVETPTDWMSQLVRSLTAAGTADLIRPPITIGVPDDSPSPTPSG